MDEQCGHGTARSVIARTGIEVVVVEEADWQTGRQADRQTTKGQAMQLPSGLKCGVWPRPNETEQAPLCTRPRHLANSAMLLVQEN